MRNLLFILFILCFNINLKSQSVSITYVPDDAFEQALVDLGLDTLPLNDFVFDSAIDTVLHLNVSGKGIYDLSGIESFTMLEILNCEVNALSSIDLSNNLNLQKLYAHYNAIDNLDLSNNSNLDYIRVNNNQIDTLLLNNPNVTFLNVQSNNIEELNLSNMNSLYYVTLSFNNKYRFISCNKSNLCNI